MKKIDKRALFTKLSFFSKSKQSLLSELRDCLKKRKKLTLIFTPNPEQLVQASRDPAFFSILQQADYLLPDGIGLVWALRFLKKQPAFRNITSPKQRLPGVEIAQALLDLAKANSYKVLIIGGRNYQQEISSWGDNIYWLEGFKDKTQPSNKEQLELEKSIKQIKPNIVFVSLGAPDQERWIVDNRQLLEKNGVNLAMVTGGAFDMIFGHLKRAPGLFRKLGLEWLFRLFQEPYRWRRQLRLLAFIRLVIL